jgi:hypothetical protein
LISAPYALRKRPIGALDIERRRLLTSQQIRLDALVPLATYHVERDRAAQ